MIHLKKNRIPALLIIMVVGAFILGCAAEVRKPLNQLDTPEHHVATGMKFIKQEKYKDAQREFDLALQLNPKFSQAHTGMGIVKACLKNYKEAFESIKSAQKFARTDEDKVFAQVGTIRLQTLAQPDKGWLSHARSAFDSAMEIDPKSAAAHYFMGVAYKTGLDFNQAGQMFTKVLDLNDDYIQEADANWKNVQKIQRAMPGTLVGKKIAILDSISRAEAAALFMEELKIDRVYEKRTIKTFDTSFKDPEKAKEARAVGKPKASDIANHPLKADIEGILEIGVRGCENYPDGAFHPEELMTRASYAMMIEDILIKVTGDQKLASKYIGSTSPFPDLGNDRPYFNAAMVVTSKGIMEVKNMMTSEFAPLGPVSGADALLVIRKIKEELKF